MTEIMTQELILPFWAAYTPGGGVWLTHIVESVKDDFYDCGFVFQTEEEAEAFCEEKREEDLLNHCKLLEKMMKIGSRA